MQKEINALVEQFTEGCITKEEFSTKTLFAAGQFAEQLVAEIQNTSQSEKQTSKKTSVNLESSFDFSITENLVVPPDLTLSGQAIWYQQKLEELSPTWQYCKYVHSIVQSAWTILHGRKHEIERKLTEVKVLRPTKGTGNGTKRTAKAAKGFSAQINSLNISDAEKVKLAKMLNIEL